jgi:hypothetical protein
MKKRLIVPLILAATSASADETAYNVQFQRAQDATGSGYTQMASGSFAYQWDRTITVQADTAINRMSDGTQNDTSLGLHASYNLTPEFRIGGYVGWEEFHFEPSNFIYHGFEFEYAIDSGSVSVFGGKNGDDGFPASDNVAFGAEVRLPASDYLTLVGRGLMRDNDALDLLTTIVGAGIDYEMPNGVTLNGELATWNRKQSGALYDDGLSITLGASLNVDRNGILLPQRNSVANTFGSDLRFP